MTDIILTPTTVDEIEFYVSNDGSITGVSISGLARLCGVDWTTIRDLVNATEGGVKTPPKWIEPLSSKVFVLGVKTNNNAKIIDVKSASRIIRYYAYESKYANEIAKHSYDKFAEIGMEKWVKQLTGFSEENKLDQLTKLMYDLLGRMDKLETTTEKYNNIKHTTVKIYPGIDYINNEIEDGYLLEPSTNDNPFTASEWLTTKGITLDKSTKHKFALLLGQTYSSITQRDPRKVMRKDKKGNLTQKLNGFVQEEIPILEIVLKKLFNQL